MADIKDFFPPVVRITNIQDADGDTVLEGPDGMDNAKLNGDVAHVDGTVVLEVGDDEDDTATYHGDVINGDETVIINIGEDDSEVSTFKGDVIDLDDNIIVDIGDDDTVSTFRGNVLNQNNATVLVAGDPTATPAVVATFAGSSNMVDVYDANDLDPTGITRSVVIFMALDDYEDLLPAEIRDDAIYLLS